MKVSSTFVGVLLTLAALVGCLSDVQRQSTPASSPPAETPDVDDFEARHVLQGAIDSLREAGSFVLRSKRWKFHGEPSHYEVVMTPRGCLGRVVTAGSGSTKFMRVDGNAWIRPDRDRLEHDLGRARGRSLDESVGRRWMLDPADSFKSICDGYFDSAVVRMQLRYDMWEGYTLELAERLGETDGDPLLRIVEEYRYDNLPRDARRQRCISSITAAKPHRFVKVRCRLADGRGYIWSDFTDEVELEAPDDDSVVDLSSGDPA